jgi:hypothetical protein
MEGKLILHHHHNKIKFGLLIFILLVIVYVGFSAATSYLSYYGGGQCRDIFDNQPIENRQKICCDESHYNSKDTLCRVKCDAIDIKPESKFCQDLKSSQSQSPMAREIERPKEISKQAPICTELKLVNYDSKETRNDLKPSNPINIEMKIQAKDLQPSYFLYEFFTIEGNDIYSIKPISFEKGKTLFAINPARYSSNGKYVDSVTALHNFFYKENLMDNNKLPKDVLVVTSIIDERGNKNLQPNYCYARFSVDPTPSYCKSFTINQKELNSDEDIKFSIESNSPTTYSYEFKFLNLKNYETSDGDKIYKPLSFQKTNGKNEPYTISKLANGNSKLSFELGWDELYKQDLNYKNRIPKEIKVEAYIKPYDKSSLQELVPCSVKFTIGTDEGLDLCKDISLSGGTKNDDGSYSLKAGQYLTIKSDSNSKNITKFTYTFHNLDNVDSGKKIDGVPDAEPIYFSKSDQYQIEKDTSKTSSKSILVSYEDLNKIDLAKGSKPKNVQVRALFTSSDDRISKTDSSCITSFKVE